MQRSTVLLIIATIIFWGVAPILDKAALKGAAPYLGTLFRGIAIGAILLIAALAGGHMKALAALPVRSMLFFLSSGIIAGILGVLTYYQALQMDATSRIVPLAATYPLVTAVLSVLLLGEQISVARLIGIALIIAGIILVK